MNRYKQLSLQEREELYGLMKSGWSLGDIGKKLKRNKGTLSRELKRNAIHVGRAPTDVYIPCKAQAKAERRASIQGAHKPLGKGQKYTCMLGIICDFPSGSGVLSK